MANKMPPAPSAAELRKAFGDTVRTLRRRIGLSQEGLAYDSGVDRGYMGGLERGEHSPTIETIYKLLPCLGVSLSEFAAEFECMLRRVRRHPR